MGIRADRSTRLNLIADEILRISSEHEFFTPIGLVSEDQISLMGVKLALVHSEASEALGVLRTPADQFLGGYNAKLDEFGEEIVDVIIRCLHILAGLGLDTEKIMLEKMAKNDSRPIRHGKLF